MWKQKINNMPFFSKLKVMLLVILLPITVIVSCIIAMSVRTIMGRSMDVNAGAFQQMKSNVCNKLNEYTTILDWMTTETDLINALQQDYKSPAKYFDRYFSEIRMARTRTLMLSSDDIRISLYAASPTVVPDYQYIYRADEPVRASAWYRDVLAREGSTCVFWEGSGEQIRLRFGRLLNPFYRNAWPVVLVMEVPVRSLTQLIADEGRYKRIYLTDQRGIILASTQPALNGTPAFSTQGLDALDISAPEALYEGGYAQGRSVLYRASLAVHPAYQGWHITSILPNQVLYSEMRAMMLWGALFFVCLVLIAMVYIRFFARQIEYRLENIMGLMNIAGQGNFSLRKIDPYHDEIGILASRFEDMLEKIDGLIKADFQNKLSIERLKRREKEAELSALHSQINPHFMFNVLECISVSLAKRNETEAMEVIGRFAFLLRRSTSISGGMIPLEEEMETVDAYMSIQMFRFRSALGYSREVAQDCLGSMIPRYTLQPLVENAVVHGIRGKEGPGTVTIRVEVQSGELVIQVLDDGNGIEPERFLAIREMLRSGDPLVNDERSIGLTNVHQRIQLHFGERYGLWLESSQGRGTRAVARMPRVRRDG